MVSWFRKNGVRLNSYYINGKFYELEEICIDPQGNHFLKHEYVTEHFRHCCKNCGHEHGVRNTDEEMKNYKVNTIFHQ